jgi:SnoaL-like domain
MTALEQQATDQSDVTTRLLQAMEAHDLEGMIATLASDVVLNSPITGRVAFHGIKEMRELMRAHFAAVKDLRYFADVGDARTRAQFYRANVNGQQVEAATRIEVNEQGQISEITIYYRPLPGLTALAVALGPPVVEARHGRLRATIARLLFVPLAFVTRLGERIVPWFS